MGQKLTDKIFTGMKSVVREGSVAIALIYGK